MVAATGATAGAPTFVRTYFPPVTIVGIRTTVNLRCPTSRVISTRLYVYFLVFANTTSVARGSSRNDSVILLFNHEMFITVFGIESMCDDHVCAVNFRLNSKIKLEIFHPRTFRRFGLSCDIALLFYIL